MKNEYKIDNENSQEKKRKIQGMFDSIVPTYDLLNRTLSLGIDNGWRKFVIKLISKDDKTNTVLDLCSGTGDLSNQLAKSGAEVVSLDFSIQMLKRGIEKGWLKKIIAADASKLPFKNDSFNNLTIAFGIRNIPDLNNFINESQRVLKSKGKLIILELTRPQSRYIKILYKFYLEFLLPFIGGLISGKKEAYKYLSDTISTFIDPYELIKILEQNGFKDVMIYRKTFGIATILECRKDEK